MLKSYVLVFLFSGVLAASAQDSTLMNLLGDSLSSKGEIVTATFKATQIVNTPTIESPGKGGLQFLIMHRFGRINEGAYALFGLDNASIRFGLDYGVNDRFAVGIGRSSLDKTFDGSIKWKLLQQKKGATPLSVSVYALIANTTLRYTDKPYMNAKYRTAYQSSLLLARKFTSRFSLQVTPTWLHYNLVPTTADKNDVLAFSVGGRLKLTKRMSINGEYNYLSSDQLPSFNLNHSLSFGVDLETGGHVFQLIFSNSEGMIGPYYLGKTNGSWGNGDIFFGFNISRYFNLKKEK